MRYIFGMIFTVVGVVILCVVTSVTTTDFGFGANSPAIVNPVPAAEILIGDVNGDKSVDTGDLVYLFNYIYRSGPPPISVNEVYWREWQSMQCKMDSILTIVKGCILPDSMLRNSVYHLERK
jgi:hypothetical protein